MADVVKYGIQIPNRVFVGGVAFDTKEDELKEFFTKYGKVKECKIVKDNQNISRGFGFVTFESKCDAIQTQQMGTVFFNQKKLNLGPAIRQKGVVFNGAKEAENEPVLSTGVYIHPSGYSYTVAPNGVWYFHNADGTPPPSLPGSPPMCYAPSVMEKTANSRRNSTESSSGLSSLETSDCGLSKQENHSTPPPQPQLVYQNSIPNEVFPMHAQQVYQAPVCQGTPNGCHSCSTVNNSNIHVAFQNMSISSHFHGNHGMYQQPPGVVNNPPPPAQHIPPGIPLTINTGNLKAINIPNGHAYPPYEEPLICYAGVHNRMGYPTQNVETKPILQQINRPQVIYPSYVTEVCHPVDQGYYQPTITHDAKNFYVSVPTATSKIKERCKY